MSDKDFVLSVHPDAVCIMHPFGDYYIRGNGEILGDGLTAGNAWANAADNLMGKTLVG